MSPSTRPATPEEVQAIVSHASELACDCGAGVGESCIRPGAGRTICKVRYIKSSISLRRQARAERQTAEQQAEQAEILAALPKVSRSDIEKCRTEKGGYSFTRTWFLDHGLPYPPIAGWRQAVEREEE